MFDAISARVNDAAGPCVMAMANAYQERVQSVTLRRYTHSRNSITPSPPGEPPAWVSGTLARSVAVYPHNLAGPRATAGVSPGTVYARIQETGGDIYPRRAKWLSWVREGKRWYSKHSHLPPRPYMSRTTEDMIGDGSLSAVAAAAFEKEVWG
jgi:hypothetical protein